MSLTQLKLPVKVIVFNNGALGFVELEQNSTGFLDTGTELVNPNFAAMAEAIGIKGVRNRGSGGGAGEARRGLRSSRSGAH